MVYKLITANYKKDFDTFVTNNLQAGFKLYGNPFVGSIDGYFCQAMIFEGELNEDD